MWPGKLSPAPGSEWPDSSICTVDYHTGRIVEIGGRPWPYEEPRMQLIPNASKAPRMLSMQALAAIATLQGVWVAVPELHAMLPGVWVQGITAGLAVLGVIGRLIDQPKAR